MMGCEDYYSTLHIRTWPSHTPLSSNVTVSQFLTPLCPRFSSHLWHEANDALSEHLIFTENSAPALHNIRGEIEWKLQSNALVRIWYENRFLRRWQALHAQGCIRHNSLNLWTQKWVYFAAGIITFLMDQFDNDFIVGIAIKEKCFPSWRLSAFGLMTGPYKHREKSSREFHTICMFTLF